MPRQRGRFQFEVHPHAACVQFFQLDQIVKYKKGSIGERRKELARYRELLSTRFDLNLPDIPLTGSSMKELEDQMDAVLCAQIAAHYWRYGTKRSTVYGSEAEGYIVVPNAEYTRETAMPVRKPDPKLVEWLGAYDPKVGEIALALRRMVLEQAPDSTELVYDAYSAVAIGFTFTGRPKDGFCHIASYPGHVNLGFNYGARLADPDRVLQGNGNQIRHIRVAGKADLKNPHLLHFLKLAILNAAGADKPTGPSVVIKPQYEKRRRPSTH
jgi:hypothetical protein